MSRADDPFSSVHLRSSIDVAMVERLVAAQFPQWAGLSVRPVATSGWDNRTFHLGDELSVRLPSGREYAEQVEKEHRWLPRLAETLPVPVSQPVAIGEPGEGYPFAWSVYRWLPGESAVTAQPADLITFAADVGDFVHALHGVDPTGGPPPGTHNFMRGGTLSTYDADTRQTLDRLGDRVDADLALAAWEDSLAAVRSTAEPAVWVHGDVAVGNLLIDHGRLSAVIDFGCMAVGDPACDLVLAWNLFHGESRAVFQSRIGLDDETWRRARGWALWKALISLPDPSSDWALAEALRALEATLDDYRGA